MISSSVVFARTGLYNAARVSLRASCSRPLVGMSFARANNSTTNLIKAASARFYSSGSNELNSAALPGDYSSGTPVVKYTDEHEWISLHDDGSAFVGITKYAADALGDATFIEVADLETEVSKGDTIGSVESVKSASELYTPITGTVVEVNETLTESPSLVNQDPMGAAWFAKLKVADPSEFDELMDLAAYEEFIKSD